MKKAIILLSIALVGSLLAGCVPGAPSATTPQPLPTSAEATAQAAAAGTPVVVGTPATAETASPQQGGSIVRAMTTEPASIDPQGAPNSGLSLVLPYLFDTLVVRDADGNVLPFLADRWDVAGDGLSITFWLHEGVTFHDGTPMDAAAVRATFERFKTQGQKSAIYSGISQIASIEEVDPLTVRFHFDAPAANIWSTLSMPYAGIISPASIEAAASSDSARLVGTGAFILDDWKPGQSLTLRRNPDYAWGPALVQNRAAPYVDSLVFQLIPDAATQLTALEAGEVDVIFINQASQRAQLESDGAAVLHEAVLNSLIYLGFNCQKAPFDEVGVRQALSHAIDKQQILDLALGGIGEVATAPLPPTLLGYDPSLVDDAMAYDPDAAISLLAESGFDQTADGGWARDGVTLKGQLLTSNRAPNDIIATLIQSQLQAIGVPVEIQQLDSKAVMEASSEGQFDLLLWRYDWSDPDALDIFLGTDNIGSTNRVAYSNPEVDALLKQGAQILDEAERAPLYVDAQRIILHDAPWQPLYNPIDVIAVSPRVHDVAIGSMGRLLLNDAWVEQ